MLCMRIHFYARVQNDHTMHSSCIQLQQPINHEADVFFSTTNANTITNIDKLPNGVPSLLPQDVTHQGKKLGAC